MKKIISFIMLFISLIGCTPKSSFKRITGIKVNNIEFVSCYYTLQSHREKNYELEYIEKTYEFINVKYELMDIIFNDLIKDDEGYYVIELGLKKVDASFKLIFYNECLYFTTEDVTPKLYCSIETFDKIP